MRPISKAALSGFPPVMTSDVRRAGSVAWRGPSTAGATSVMRSVWPCGSSSRSSAYQRPAPARARTTAATAAIIHILLPESEVGVLTEARLPAPGPLARVDRVSQAIPDEVERQVREGNGEAGGDGDMRVVPALVTAVGGPGV